MRIAQFHVLFAVLFTFLFTIETVHARFSFQTRVDYEGPNPYDVLGLKRSATDNEIKAAYRSLAKQYHPDKNLDNSEFASEKFRKIAEAYELLSDKQKKRNYDVQYTRQYEQQRQRQQAEMRRREERKVREQREAMRKRTAISKKARQLQRKIIRITTIQELKSMAVDQHGVLKHNLLLVFVADKNIENFVDNEMFFPYLSNLQPEEFDGFIRAIKVRYNSDTELTTFLGVPSHNQAQRSGKATILVGIKGKNLMRLKKYTARPDAIDPQGEFESWVSNVLSARVYLTNHHHSSVRLFHLTSNGALNDEWSVGAGDTVYIDVLLGDWLWVLDSNLDKWPGHKGRLDMSLLNAVADNVLLGRWKILKDDEIDIVSKRCLDMSTLCDRWITFGHAECDTKPEFMHSMCAKTCGVCSDSPLSFLSYRLLHEPISRWPRSLRYFVVQFRILVDEAESSVAVFQYDMAHVLTFRKNAAGAIFVLGFTFALVCHDLDHRSTQSILFRLLLFVFSSAFVFLWSDGAFVEDMAHVLSFRRNVIFVFALIGFVVAYILSIILDLLYVFTINDTASDKSSGKVCKMKVD